ncbi:11-beta-hydroxysteroid dehydrogenase-like 5 isoform X2 [Phalaenopsis equestris]|uniref:11-beta-hydroxysteroid dehydrogenase-like 5 isoform X2 n=1 Tax=Phalaenopsis equestris TaxID=78828 RepID=UPI0009E51D28|nr:11-beta-hydroxysteroid dehydrogenase-like 5 isoform X2 [Phalaenopsis equestris]
MDLMNYFINLVAPPASMLMMAFAWPTLAVLRAAEWIYRTINSENMEGKVVVITGASSAMGEKITYQYAIKKANLVLVAKREQRLWGIRENARLLGANLVVVIAADVVKDEECRRFINDTINYFVDHLVNTTNLGHSFYFEDALDTSMFPHLLDINFWGSVYPTYFALPYLRESHGRIIVNASVESWVAMPRMSLYAAAKAAVINFYETLRLELKDDVGITIATHGWICREMNQTKFMFEEGADMQWKEDRELPIYGAHVEEFAKMIVDGACRGEAYVKYPTWSDALFLYKVLTPDVLRWTFRLLFAGRSGRKGYISGNNGASRPLLEAPLARKDTPPPSAPASPNRR